jgi:hypothetical protein
MRSRLVATPVACALVEVVMWMSSIQKRAMPGVSCLAIAAFDRRPAANRFLVGRRAAGVYDTETGDDHR